MGVYIKGMEMPKSCGKCKMHFLSSNDYVCCSITDRIPKSIAKFTNSKTDLDFRKASIEAVSRPDWCPLVEVKATHGRLGDLDEVEHVIGQHSLSWEYGQGVSDCWDDVVSAPTIIEAEE